MEDKKEFKPDKALIGLLQPGNERKNLEGIEKMKIEGTPDYLPTLIDLAVHTDSEKVRSEIFNLLNQLKDKQAASFIAEALSQEKNASIVKQLIEACWQNGLNYAPHLPVFIYQLIHGADDISFEAFTVIENMEYMPGNTTLKEEAAKVEAHIKNSEGSRQYFLKETLKILTNVINQETES